MAFKTEKELKVSARYQNKSDTDLTKEEYEALFDMIRNSTFRGVQLESTYRMVVKLQNQYNLLKK